MHCFVTTFTRIVHIQNEFSKNVNVEIQRCQKELENLQSYTFTYSTKYLLSAVGEISDSCAYNIKSLDNQMELEKIVSFEGFFRDYTPGYLFTI